VTSLAPVALVLAGCASAAGGGVAGGAGPEVVLDADDARGDVRLVHPEHPDIDRGTFDLEHVRFYRDGEGGDWRLEVTFVSPVRAIGEVRAARDRVLTIYPQTIDVYLDMAPDAGQLAALPGRRFRVPASQAWDRALVATSVPDLSEDDAVQARSLTANGRRLIATFSAAAVPWTPKGVLVVVLATAPSGEGRVRAVGPSGECRVWDADRCLLKGDGPPVLDARGVSPEAGRPLALLYPGGDPPPARTTPIVFQRGTLIGAAPVEGGLEKGRLATIVAADGAALGTAVVLSVVGDTASLELVSKAPIDGASAVVFAAPAAGEAP